MCSARDSAALPALGCPIRESPDQRLLNAYPGLIAVVHALLRLLVPRHPPCALNILTVIKSGRAEAPAQKTDAESVRPRLCFLGSGSAVFKGRGAARSGDSALARSLKTQQRAPAARGRRPSPVDMLRTGEDPGAAGFPTAIPRKEVIQPHLPVRLPCYDFTPVTGPTFDGSLPNGLGHRLRVLPTSVV
jgi:hypothetical protein